MSSDAELKYKFDKWFEKENALGKRNTCNDKTRKLKIAKDMHIPNKLYEKIKTLLPIACVDLVVIDHGSYLLALRDYPPAKGEWWFPGGRILKGERIFDAATRKGKEELGLQLKPLELISVEESIFDENNGEIIHTINFVVKMKKRFKSQNIVLDHTHSEFSWFDKISVDLHPCVKSPLLKLNFPTANT